MTKIICIVIYRISKRRLTSDVDCASDWIFLFKGRRSFTCDFFVKSGKTVGTAPSLIITLRSVRLRSSSRKCAEQIRLVFDGSQFFLLTAITHSRRSFFPFEGKLKRKQFVNHQPFTRFLVYLQKHCLIFKEDCKFNS